MIAQILQFCSTVPSLTKKGNLTCKILIWSLYWQVNHRFDIFELIFKMCYALCFWLRKCIQVNFALFSIWKEIHILKNISIKQDKTGLGWISKAHLQLTPNSCALHQASAPQKGCIQALSRAWELGIKHKWFLWNPLLGL